MIRYCIIENNEMWESTYNSYDAAIQEVQDRYENCELEGLEDLYICEYKHVAHAVFPSQEIRWV